MKKRAILCLLKTDIHDHWEFKIQIEELRRLVTSMDYEIVQSVVQQRVKKYSDYMIGKGKVDEIKELVDTYKVDVVIFYNILTSKQNYNLASQLQCEIKDRFDLILDIFEQNSSDNLSKMQIRLAQLIKTFPKYKIQAHKKFQKEHAYLGSTGEFAYHSKIRAYDKQIAKIRSDLNILKDKKMEQIDSRKQGQFPFKTICIGGYYNAGKTTLFNALTGEDKLVSDKPFTTLSSKYSSLKSQSKIIIIDTIGFVYDIDPNLIKSFELQILDMKNAEKMLYLIGLDDELEFITQKFQYGLKLWEDIGVLDSKIIIVFNKMDLVSEEFIKNLLKTLEDPLKKFPHTFISAKSSKNLDSLIKLF